MLLINGTFKIIRRVSLKKNIKSLKGKVIIKLFVLIANDIECETAKLTALLAHPVSLKRALYQISLHYF